MSAESRIAPLAGPLPAWYSTLRDVADDEGTPKDVRVAAVEALSAYGALRLDRRELYTEMARRDLEARAELARRDATIAAVSELADELEQEAAEETRALKCGRLTANETVEAYNTVRLLSEDVVPRLRATLSAPVEAVATEPAPSTVTLDDLCMTPEQILDGVHDEETARARLARMATEYASYADHGFVPVPVGWLRALTEAGAPAEPGYQRIADAIAAACDTAALTLTARRGGVPVEEPYLRLARVLDKAGLIDWAAFADTPAEPTSDTEP